MKSIIRLLVLYLALSSAAHAIVDGAIDVNNTYSSVGYTGTLGGAFGSLVAIDSSWVLTAAHVVAVDVPTGVLNPPVDSPVFMVLGNPQQADPFGPGEQFFIFFDEVIIHPNYVSGEFHDDLALIKVSQTIPDTDAIDLASGLEASFATLSNVDLDFTSPDFLPLPAATTITGYGQLTVGGDPQAGDILRYQGDAVTYAGDPFVTLGAPFVDPGFPYDCSQAMMLCTYSTGAPPGSNAGGAPGDSGGAMFVDYGGGDVVAGINSFIFDENDIDPNEELNWENGYWTVGTSTAFYEGWIRGVVEGDGGTVNFGAAPVPLPPAIYLFVAGLIGVMGITRRRSYADVTS